MVFSSNSFLIVFLPLSVLFYYLIVLCSGKKYTVANIWLLAVSVFFYAWGEPVYVYVMILSIIMNFIFGKLLLSEKVNGKLTVALACIYNIGVLFVFKYLEWITGRDLGIALPIGISFYTFQSLSYILDIYRGGYSSKQTGLINVGLYIAFFPQLIAGPIVRFSTVAEQLNSRKHSFDKFSRGMWRFAEGLAKKVLLANQLAALTDMAFDSYGTNTVVFAWVGALACLLQIYFDFSGYSDMAIGLGKMFGFDFNENFNYPFMAKSVTEYWRRWHISLGEWFRDYLFYPLSIGPAVKLRALLGKKMNAKTAASVTSFSVLLVVWIATGIWHGANLTFLVWGLIQFAFIVSEQHCRQIKGLCHVKTLLVCILGIVIFQSASMSDALTYYADMFGLSHNPLINQVSGYWIGQFAGLIVSAIVFSFPIIPALDGFFGKNKHTEFAWNLFKTVAVFALFAFSISCIIGDEYNPFIYFNF